MKNIILTLLTIVISTSQAQINCNISSNLITNGDFSEGNIGFTTDYTYSSSAGMLGYYYIGGDPSRVNKYYYANIIDHTSGLDTNMLIVDIDPLNKKAIYRTNVLVETGKTYFLSVWAANINNNPYPKDPPKYQNSPIIKFLINDLQTGNNQYIDSLSNNWTQYYISWTSNLSGIIPIEIQNGNTNMNGNGNDLALDDISFSSDCEVITNISEVNHNASPCIYPNPAIDVLNIEYLNGESFSIHNMYGQKIVDSKLINGSASVDVSAYESGIYTLTVKSLKNETKYSVMVR